MDIASRHREEFQDLARKQYAKYKRACGEKGIENLGLVLFLDSGFADPDSRIAVLGINPGGNKPAGEDGFRPPGNGEPRIWNGRRDGQANRRFERYWANMRDMLTVAAQVKGGLEDQFDHAFFGNVFAFRSPNWTGAPPVHKAIMREYGSPITRFLFERNLYDTVICVGPDVVHALAYHAEPVILDRIKVCRTFPDEMEQWPRRCVEHFVHCRSGETVHVLEVPHLSCPGQSDARAFGQWLGERLSRGAL